MLQNLLLLEKKIFHISYFKDFNLISQRPRELGKKVTSRYVQKYLRHN